MLIYADDIKLHRRHLQLRTNKPNNAQMSELLIIAVNNYMTFHRETEKTDGVYYNIKPK